MARIEIPIEGMTCDHCVRTVTQALLAVPGVRSAQVSLSTGKAIVEWGDGQPSRDALAEAVARAGYRVGPSAARPPRLPGSPPGAAARRTSGLPDLPPGMATKSSSSPPSLPDPPPTRAAKRPPALPDPPPSAAAAMSSSRTARPVAAPADKTQPPSLKLPTEQRPPALPSAAAAADPAAHETVLDLASVIAEVEPSSNSSTTIKRPPSKPEPEAHEIDLDIEGMTCASCVSRVEKALSAVPGVRSARANLATNQAAIDFAAQPPEQAALLDAVRRAGYKATITDHSHHAGVDLADRGARERAQWRNLLLVALVLLAIMAAVDFAAPYLPARPWIMLACATLLQFGVGWPFYLGALRRTLTLSTNMDTLITIGTLAAYGAGAYEVLAGAGHAGHATGGHSMYLMDAGTILTFITLGKYLEARAKGRASAAIIKLLDLAPPVANVLRDGNVATVSANQVAEGDTIVVRPGDKVPLDAEVLSGNSSLDQSWLTGESRPVEKRPGDEILAGTINGQGSLTARVTRPAGRTALAQVVALVRRAQESKTEVQRLADRVVGWFVPVVLVIAAVTLLAWGLAGNWNEALASMVSVLVVACPCALGLATPTAILVASGRGAEMGILIKEAHALEIAGRVTTVVLDKTGTVTSGKPNVSRLMPTADSSAEELLATAAAVEQLTRHPLAEPIVRAAQEQNLRLPQARNLEIVPGLGVCAAGKAGELVVGNDLLLTARGVNWLSQEAEMEAFRREGQIPLGVAAGNRYLGLIVLTDTVAPHSRQAVKQLKDLGLGILLLSGDNRRIAERVAREVDIDQVTAEVLPEQKEALISHLRQGGEVVAMVGDGINDAPALAAADLGIAIGSGSDIAIEAAQVVITGGDLRSVASTVQLARATLRTIRQNLAWAFVYNLLLIPIAAGVLVPVAGVRLPAVAAAAAMALSSVSVVANSLLLRRRNLS